MKKIYMVFMITLLCFINTTTNASEPIVQQVIVNTSGNLRGQTVVLAMMQFNAPTAGRAVVRFDGYCVSDSGDRIVLAASNTPSWGANDGNVAVQASHPNNKRRSFSHTRIYNIPAGLDTFYAVGENFVDMDGSGVAAVYGHLTLEFFPVGGPAMVIDSNINFNGDIRSVQKVIGKVFSNAEPAGKVLVHADGQVFSDAGDRIMLSAVNMPSWLVGTGSVAVMALSSTQRISPYSHSRIYTQNASPDSFYLVTRNVVNVAGSGTAYIHGNLSAEFFPSTGVASVTAHSCEFNDVQARGQAVAFDSITITASEDGYALAQLDGYCTSSVGDRIIFAVSNTPNWSPNEGCVAVSAASSANAFNIYSHSRLFPVTAGTHTFYSVTQNYVDVAGNGLVDIEGNFTVKYFPEVSSGINEAAISPSFHLYPNPASDMVTIKLNENAIKQDLRITDITGRLVQVVATGTAEQLQLNVAAFAPGVYILECNGYTQRLIKQ